MDGMHQSIERGSTAAWSAGFSHREFIHDEAFGGILLLVCVVIALIRANSP